MVCSFVQADLTKLTIPVQAEELSYEREELIRFAYSVAEEYGLDAPLFVRTISCESDFIFSAIGDGGHSFGAVQIHLPAHPEITKEQALNPYWSIRWMAEQWKDGYEWKWTCWKMLT